MRAAVEVLKAANVYGAMPKLDTETDVDKIAVLQGEKIAAAEFAKYPFSDGKIQNTHGAQSLA